MVVAVSAGEVQDGGSAGGRTQRSSYRSPVTS